MADELSTYPGKKKGWLSWSPDGIKPPDASYPHFKMLPALCFLLLVVLSTVAGEKCADRHPNCPFWKKNGFCTHPLYADIRTTCTISCGLCTSSSSGTANGTTAACADSNVQNCGRWVVNGFCTNKRWTDAQKKQYCAASCGLC